MVPIPHTCCNNVFTLSHQDTLNPTPTHLLPHLQALRGLPQLSNHLDALCCLVRCCQQALAQNGCQLPCARLHLGCHLLERALQHGRARHGSAGRAKAKAQGG